MKELSIYYVEKESTVQGAHLFDMLGNNISNYSKFCNEFYFNFLTLDSENNYCECLIPQKVIEIVFKKPILDYHSFSSAIVGKGLDIELGDELTTDLIDSFESGNEMLSVFKQASNYFLVDKFKFNLSVYNSTVLPLFEKKKSLYDGKFEMSPANWNFIEGGYDVDSAFDGNPEAYWNID